MYKETRLLWIIMCNGKSVFKDFVAESLYAICMRYLLDYSFTRCTYVLHFTLLTIQIFLWETFLSTFSTNNVFWSFFSIWKKYFFEHLYSLSFCFLKTKYKKKKIHFYEYSLIIFCVSTDVFNRFFVARLSASTRRSIVTNGSFLIHMLRFFAPVNRHAINQFHGSSITLITSATEKSWIFTISDQTLWFILYFNPS